ILRVALGVADRLRAGGAGELPLDPVPDGLAPFRGGVRPEILGEVEKVGRGERNGFGGEGGGVHGSVLSQGQDLVSGASCESCSFWKASATGASRSASGSTPRLSESSTYWLAMTAIRCPWGAGSLRKNGAKIATASCAAARASSRRPRALKYRPRLLSEEARSGRKASGRAAARRRRISTASWAAASASSRRPSALRRLPRLLSEEARSGRKASGRAAARRRRISTASWAAASASSRRPSALRRLPR